MGGVGEPFSGPSVEQKNWGGARKPFSSNCLGGTVKSYSEIDTNIVSNNKLDAAACVGGVRV